MFILTNLRQLDEESILWYAYFVWDEYLDLIAARKRIKRRSLRFYQEGTW